MQRLFLLFTDLDQTITPLCADGIVRLISVVKRIESHGVKCRIIPITGRAPEYALAFLHVLNASFERERLFNVCEVAAGEQGATIIYVAKSYDILHLGGRDDVKERVAHVIAKSEFAQMLADEPGKRFTCSIHIKNEWADTFDSEKKKSILHSLSDAVIREIGSKVIKTSLSHKTLEIMSADVSKNRALEFIMNEYSASYDICGISYSADAANDLECVKWVAEFAGRASGKIKTHVFLPSNAGSCLDCSQASDDTIIQRAKRPLLDGVLDLVESALDAGELFFTRS